MSYTPPKIYGSLYMNNNSAVLNTSGGGDTKVTGWTAGDSSGTTVSATNNNITINQTGEVNLIFNAAIGSNGTTGIVYYFKFYLNGSVFASNKATVGTNASAFSSSLWMSGINMMYSATYGDVIDVRVSIANGSDPTNRPVIYLGAFNVIGM